MNDLPYSHVIKAMEWWQAPEGVGRPEGKFGPCVWIGPFGGELVWNEFCQMEFEVPFGNDSHPREAKCSLFNLTDETIEAIEMGQIVQVCAGYGHDTAVIFTGVIQKALTRFAGPDKITTLYAADGVSPKMKGGGENLPQGEKLNLSYAAGLRASFLLEDLVARAGWPVGAMRLGKDFTFVSQVVLEGEINQCIERIARLCDAMAYIENGVLFVVERSGGPAGRIDLSVETGMIGDPEEFYEQDGAAGQRRGVQVSMLLDYRAVPEAELVLTSKRGTRRYRIQTGRHTFDGLKMVTQVKALEE